MRVCEELAMVKVEGIVVWTLCEGDHLIELMKRMFPNYETLKKHHEKKNKGLICHTI